MPGGDTLEVPARSGSEGDRSATTFSRVGAAITEHQSEAMTEPDHRILIGKGDTPQFLDLGLANRHGLIAGATGTGKTVSLQVLAEGFSAHGVPVFVADVKGRPVRHLPARHAQSQAR